MASAEPTGPATGEGRIARSWRLSKLTWRLVRSDPAMLVLAAMSSIVSAALLAVVYDLGGVFSGKHHGNSRLALATLILAFPLTFASVFFNTAIAAAAAARLDGKRLSVGEALAVPLRRIDQVVLWSLLSSVVGIVIEQIASRLPPIGSIAARLFGLSWGLASIFAVPILATEGCSARQCLTRSARLVKKRWGEGIAGNVIITAWLGFALLGLGVLLGFALVATRHSEGTRAAALTVIVVAFVLLIAASGAIRQAFAVVLYRYATAGTAPGPFTEADLSAPFSRGLAGRRTRATAQTAPRGWSRQSFALWVAAAVPAALLTALWEANKHHYAAHRLAGRIAGGVIAFLVLFLLLRLVLALGAWLSRR